MPRPDADAQRDGFGAHTVGGEETARGLCADDFTVLDYGDNYVYPGFPEAHCHPGGARALWHRPNVRREVDLAFAYAGDVPDFSLQDCWLQVPEITKDVDTFYIYSTAYIESSFAEGSSDYVFGNVADRERLPWQDA